MCPLLQNSNFTKKMGVSECLLTIQSFLAKNSKSKVKTLSLPFGKLNVSPPLQSTIWSLQKGPLCLNLNFLKMGMGKGVKLEL